MVLLFLTCGSRREGSDGDGDTGGERTSTDNSTHSESTIFLGYKVVTSLQRYLWTLEKGEMVG